MQILWLVLSFINAFIVFCSGYNQCHGFINCHKIEPLYRFTIIKVRYSGSAEKKYFLHVEVNLHFSVLFNDCLFSFVYLKGSISIVWNIWYMMFGFSIFCLHSKKERSLIKTYKNKCGNWRNMIPSTAFARISFSLMLEYPYFTWKSWMPC